MCPYSFSVKDGIASELFLLEYKSIDQSAKVGVHNVQGSLMVKLDFQSACREGPAHPEDHHLHGLVWQGTMLCERALPFGLHSAQNYLPQLLIGLNGP